MDAAWEFQITTFDTADAYGGGRSETTIGKWMASRGVRPEIATKTFNPMAEGQDHGLARTRISRQIESSLDRLGVDAVDLYLAHAFDPDVPVEETIATFEGLIQLKLIKAYGVSNFDAEQLGSILGIGKPALVQNSYSLLDRADAGVAQLCAELGIAYSPYGPLAGGWLTGKYKRDESVPDGSRMSLRPEPYEHLRRPETFTALERFAELATRRGVDSATLAIGWLFAQPWVTAVVVGPRRAKHLEPALHALEHPLSQAEADEVAAIFE
jgi:aryl-alcohol dehydrogenase-like predicted oxidoreductase